MALDPYSGEAVSSRAAAEMGPFQRWIHTADPLHFGDFAGLWLKVVYFAFGLLISLSIIAGATLWVLRLSATHSALSRRNRAWLATANLVTALVLAAATAPSLIGMAQLRAAGGVSTLDYGRHALGPWRPDVLLALDASGGAEAIHLVFPAVRPNLVAAFAEITLSGETSRLELSLEGRTLETRDQLPGRGVDAGIAAWHGHLDAMHFLLEGQDGEQHTLALGPEDFSLALDKGTKRVAEVPASPAVDALIYGFLALLWVMLLLWVGVQVFGFRAGARIS